MGEGEKNKDNTTKLSTIFIQFLIDSIIILRQLVHVRRVYYICTSHGSHIASLSFSRVHYFVCVCVCAHACIYRKRDSKASGLSMLVCFLSSLVVFIHAYVRMQKEIIKGIYELARGTHFRCRETAPVSTALELPFYNVQTKKKVG